MEECYLNTCPIILAFDTASAHCAVALMHGDTILADEVEYLQRGQAERLMSFLKEILGEHNLQLSDLDLIGVGTGPGNFTGIRLSVSLARGLALALGVPAIGVSTFQAMAHEVDKPCLVALEARRDQLYLQLFGGNNPKPILADLNNLPDWVQHAQTLVGDGAEKISPFVKNMNFMQSHSSLCVNIARIAGLQMNADTPRPTPMYLRPADAKPPKSVAPEIIA